MNTDLMFSSKAMDWETPQELFDELNAEWNFDLDVCALPQNKKCANYFSPEDDGLGRSWKGHICFMNPPYGRKIGKWVKKAYDESVHAVTVCLLPARTDTRWFHDYILDKAEIRFLKGRLLFSPNGDRSRRAPFPSMVVTFKLNTKHYNANNNSCKSVVDTQSRINF